MKLDIEYETLLDIYATAIMADVLATQANEGACPAQIGRAKHAIWALLQQAVAVGEPKE